jgi:phosphoglycerate-specific signal transduction histidine kinase
MDYTKLKAIRSGHRSAITRLFKRIPETEDENSKNEIVKILQEKRELLEKINGEILEGLSNEEEIQTEIEETDEYMLDLRLKLQELKKVSFS